MKSPVTLHLKQETLLDLVAPLIEQEGKQYQKSVKVIARLARAGERIETITSDGLETANTATSGDYIVTNPTSAGEQYIIPAEKFEARYELKEQLTSQKAVYQAIGTIRAVKLTATLLTKLHLPDEFSFIAPWGENMVAKKGDYLATPLPNTGEVYRIAAKEFRETYQLKN
jgi:hypothetical protein